MENKIMRKQFIFISFAVGLLGLGQEIAWVKLVSFLGKSVPQAFSFVLFMYVLGIAIGAYKGSKLINSNKSHKEIISTLLLYSSSAAFLTPFFLTLANGYPFLIIVISLLILWGAAFKGAIFPLVHHWCSKPGKQLGNTLSTVYFANVFGASLGPLLVGFWILDNISIIELLVYIGCIELIIAFLLVYRSISLISVCKLIPICVLCFFSVINASGVMNTIIQQNFDETKIVENIVENKHGIIYTIHDTENNIDQIYGGNVYDGAFNVNLSHDINRINRAYLLPLLHKAPKRILFIGLSSGSWLRVVASIPEVEHIDVVEINSGYPKIVEKFPGAEILKDSRINFIYEDGRQIVKKAVETGNKYDLVVMNTTWHWRAYTTNLLSLEFFSMVKNILNPKAVFAFNSTSSLDVFFTASQVFDYSYLFGNFIYSSDINLKNELASNSSRVCELDPVFIDGQNCTMNDFNRNVELLKQSQLIEWAQIKNEGRMPEIVSDDNMIIEYKFGKAFSL